MDLNYAIHLGDFIDRDWESFDIVSPIYNRLEMPHYHVLGNHDFSVPDEKKVEVVKKMGLPSDYYDFEIKGWRFVVLNGNDISFHAYPENSEEYQFATEYYQIHKIDSPKWNGALGVTQIQWLKEVLKKATKKDEKVILYCHFPIYPENVHNLWNANEIIEIIEEYACVKAYMNGHNHEGNYGVKNGVHYLTFKGMVDTEQNSYGVIKVFQNHLTVEGYGREENRTLEITK
jgi:predicted MPP superfamily phosphohydrolase